MPPSAMLGMVVIVSPQPAGCKILGILKRFKQVMGQPVVAQGTVIALDISILLRLARLDEVDANAQFGGPDQRHGADVFGTIIVD